MPGKSAAILIDEEFGTPTRPVIDPLNNSIGTTILPLLRNDPNRIAFHVVNLSSNTIYVGPFSDVSSTRGWRIGPGGGALRSTYQIDWHLVAMEWYVVASASSSGIFTLAIVTN